MKKESITYAAIFNNGKFVEKDTLEEISVLHSAFFWLKIEFHHEQESYYGKSYDNFLFIPINLEEKPITIRKGDFEIIDIGPETKPYNQGMEIKILDIKNNTAHLYLAKNNGLLIFETEIIPLLNKLNELGSWKNYLLSKKTKKLEEKNEELLQKIEELTKKNEELIVENKALKVNGGI